MNEEMIDMDYETLTSLEIDALRPMIRLAKNNERLSKGRDLLRLVVTAINKKFAEIGLYDDLVTFSKQSVNLDDISRTINTFKDLQGYGLNDEVNADVVKIISKNANQIKRLTIYNQLLMLELAIQINSFKGNDNGIMNLYNHCHHYIMDNEDEVHAMPIILQKRLQIYNGLWRGKKSKYTSSIYLQQIVEFCEKHIDYLLQNEIDGDSFQLRELFKQALFHMERDVKVDAYDLKERIEALMNKDSNILIEDKMKIMQRVQAEYKAEDEIVE